MLRVGDTVNWKGSWGGDLAKEVKVTEMELCEEGSKYGEPKTEMDWETVQEGRRVVVSLDNGHWAYGYQLEPLKEI